jgi:hypothetical protein
LNRKFDYFNFSASGEITVSLHGCNTSHAVRLLDPETGLATEVFSLRERDDGTGLAKRMAERMQVLPITQLAEYCQSICINWGFF